MVGVSYSRSRAIRPARSNAKINDIFEDFLTKSNSAHTRDAYRRDLKKFLTFLKGFETFSSLSDVSQRHISAYRDHLLKNEELKDATVARHLSSIKRFFDFLVEKELCYKNPATGVFRPKVVMEVKTNDLSASEVMDLFESVNQNNRDGSYNLSGVLHYTILRVMFYTLLRKSELIALKVGDFASDNIGNYLHVRSKGGKKQKVYISDETFGDIKHYMEVFRVRREFLENEPLFTSGRKSQELKPLNRNTIDQIFQKYAKLAGIKHRISPHSSRATGIGNLYENGASLEDQATYARHSDPRMTFLYNKRRKEKINEIANIVNYLDDKQEDEEASN
ncbi:tyrosine-type recombinase/integrase [Halobacteriovorax sp. CON-3]|uniref:tyrosine-type recombinase/integrase n=1 Tax=Halobacteriovorax sp. CON-3 TaxID=3157710 RepID=UPI00371136B4